MVKKVSALRSVKNAVFGVILVRILTRSDRARTRITPNTDTFYIVLFFLCTSALSDPVPIYFGVGQSNERNWEL